MAVDFRVYRRLKLVNECKVTCDHPWPRYRENGQTKTGYKELRAEGMTRIGPLVKVGPGCNRKIVQLTDKGYMALKDYELEHNLFK